MPTEGTPRFTIRFTEADKERIARIREAEGTEDVASTVRRALFLADPKRPRKKPRKSV